MDEDIYWVEMRPAEGGRQVIVKRDKLGQLSDINPQPFNARTRVHEYGGGDYLAANGTVYFSNFADQRLYKVLPVKRRYRLLLPPKCATQKRSWIVRGIA